MPPPGGQAQVHVTHEAGPRQPLANLGAARAVGQVIRELQGEVGDNEGRDGDMPGAATAWPLGGRGEEGKGSENVSWRKQAAVSQAERKEKEPQARVQPRRRLGGKRKHDEQGNCDI